MNNPPDKLVGQTIDGRFRLDRLLGAGGMGKVYQGVQLSVERPVAIKVLRSDLSELPSIQKRFFREAQVLASLHHPNIVGLVDFGRDDESGALYMAMHYVEGKPLSGLVRAGRLPLGVSLSIARQICSGLIEAHAAGVVHRDLKPDNIMLQTTAEGTVVAKILDFGIALPSGRDETKFTQTGAIMGTPYYMSPEQAQGIPVGPASDLYSVGVMLYEMVTGDVPFRGDTPLAVLYKTVNERHTPVAELLDRTQDSGPLGELIDDLLEKSPAGRPGSASEVALRLDTLRGQHEVPTVENVQKLETLVQPALDASAPVPAGALLPGSAPERRSITNHEEAQTGAESGDRGLPVLVVVAGVLLVMGLLVTGALVAGGLYFMGSDLDATTSKPVAQAPSEPEAVAEVDQPKSTPVENGGAKAEPAAPSPPARPKTKPTRSKSTKQVEEPTPPAKPKPTTATKRKNMSTSHSSCMRNRCDVNLTKKGASYSCMGDVCSVGCEAGGCSQRCMSGTCTFDCEGGGCEQKCFPDSTCIFACSGGDCERSRFDGSKVTERD